MRRAIAGVVILAFASLLCTSLIAIFTGNAANSHYMASASLHYPYYIAY